MIGIIVIIIGVVIYGFLAYKLHKDWKASQKENDLIKQSLQKQSDELLKKEKELNKKIDNFEKERVAQWEKVEKELLVYRIERQKQIFAEVDEQFDEMREKRLAEVEQSIEANIKLRKQDAKNKIANINKSVEDRQIAADKEIEKINDEVNGIKKQIEDALNVLQSHKDNLKAIYEDNARRLELEAQQEHYRIQLSDDALSDINLLRSIQEKLHFRESFDKLIYDVYIAKPVLELTRRVVVDKKVSGIYKITNIDSKMIYIGQSTDIENRWKGHIKSAFGLEGVADSVFQRALKKYGVHNFTFEILEKVPKEQLKEKEKYWIDFYQSNKYGYNQKLG